MTNVIHFKSEFNSRRIDRPETGHNAGLPHGLVPVRHWIIATHIYGWRQVGAVTAEIVRDLQFRRQARPRHHARGLG